MTIFNLFKCVKSYVHIFCRLILSADLVIICGLIGLSYNTVHLFFMSAFLLHHIGRHEVAQNLSQ